MLIQWIIIGTVVVVGFILTAFLLWGLKAALKLLFNSLIGFFALWITKAIFLSELVINLWSILLTAFFGIVGFVLVIIGHFVGIF